MKTEYVYVAELTTLKWQGNYMKLCKYTRCFKDFIDVCDYLCVSYSTIRSLLSKMNKTFSSYHIEFTCEKEQICIKGNVL